MGKEQGELYLGRTNLNRDPRLLDTPQAWNIREALLQEYFPWYGRERTVESEQFPEAESNLIIVTGASSAGKSTLLKRLSLAAMKSYGYEMPTLVDSDIVLFHHDLAHALGLQTHYQPKFSSKLNHLHKGELSEERITRLIKWWDKRQQIYKNSFGDYWDTRENILDYNKKRREKYAAFPHVITDSETVDQIGSDLFWLISLIAPGGIGGIEWAGALNRLQKQDIQHRARYVDWSYAGRKKYVEQYSDIFQKRVLAILHVSARYETRLKRSKQRSSGEERSETVSNVVGGADDFNTLWGELLQKQIFEMPNDDGRSVFDPLCSIPLSNFFHSLLYPEFLRKTARRENTTITQVYEQQCRYVEEQAKRLGLSAKQYAREHGNVYSPAFEQFPQALLSDIRYSHDLLLDRINRVSNSQQPRYYYS